MSISCPTVTHNCTWQPLKFFNFFFLSIIRFCHRVAKQKTQQNYSFTQKMVQKPKWKYYWEMTKTVADLIIYIFFCQTIMPPISIEQKLTKNAINKQEFIFFAKAFIFCRYACLPACIYILSNLLLLNWWEQFICWFRVRDLWICFRIFCRYLLSNWVSDITVREPKPVCCRSLKLFNFGCLYVGYLPDGFANEIGQGYKNALTISDKFQVYSESRMANYAVFWFLNWDNKQSVWQLTKLIG